MKNIRVIREKINFFESVKVNVVLANVKDNLEFTYFRLSTHKHYRKIFIVVQSYHYDMQT